MPLTACGECLKTLYVTETEVFDKLLGSELWLWGPNPSGNIGDNTTTAAVETQPITVKKGWTNVATGTNAILTTAATAAIKDDGTLWTWGSAAQGQLGNNTSTGNRSSPVQTISQASNWKDIGVGCQNMAAVKQDGTLWTWGSNASGNLGTNSTTNSPRSSPVQTTSGGGNWRCLSVNFQSVAATKTDGTLWVWGSNLSGILGDNSAANKSSPVQTVSAATNWEHVSVGTTTMGGIKTDGTLWLWGSNTSGQHGNNTTTSQSSPVQTISGGSNWKQLSVGTHVGAIKTDGTLWLWGNNAQGQLGINTTTPDRSSPVQTVSGGGNWKQVGVTVAPSSLTGTGAVKLDGTLWTWGVGTSNFTRAGGSTISRSSPIQIGVGGTNWTCITGGNGYMAGKRITTRT